jgi:hypothetical protein
MAVIGFLFEGVVNAEHSILGLDAAHVRLEDLPEVFVG